jgi:AcrR family transcriptional regulator
MGLVVEVADSLNAERHPHLRQRVLDRELHGVRCVGCARTIVVENRFLYVDLARRQVLGVFQRADREDADRHAREVEAMFARWFQRDAPRWIRDRSARCLVRACFGLEELREKLVGDDAGLDDLAIEALRRWCSRAIRGFARPA